MGQNGHEQPIVISGADNVKAVQNLTRLHFWRMTAQMKTKFNMSPRRGFTIRAFNDEYGQKAKTWTDVATIANEMIKETRS